MIGLENDVSVSTLVVSAVIAGVGWAVKGAAKLLIAAIETVVKKMVETISKVDTLDAKLASLVQTIGDVGKMRQDQNEYFRRLKQLEADFQQLKQ